MQRKILNLIGLLVILSFFPICVFAGFTLTPCLTPPDDTESCMYNVLQKDNNWYAIEGSEIELEYDYDTTDGKQVDSLTYQILFGGITIDPITYPSDSLEVGTNKIPLPIPQEKVTPGTYHMSALVKYTDDTNNTIDFYVTIYEKPSIEKNGDWQSWNSEDPMHIWDTQDAKLGVSCSADDEGLNVSYIWDGDAAGHNNPSWQQQFSDFTGSSVYKYIELTVNCMPAGLSFDVGKYLYREKFNFTYKVWKSPRESEVTLSVHVGENVRDKLYWYLGYSSDIFGQRSVSVNVPENLSGDAWNYKWICGNDTIQQAPDVDNRYFVSESLNGITGLDDIPDEGFERNLMALVTYCPDESLKPDTVETDPIVVHIFHEPEAYLKDNRESDTTYTIWSDSTISLQYVKSGGYEAGWVYEWLIDNVKQPDSGDSFEYPFDTYGNSVVSYQVKTDGTNLDPQGDRWYDSDNYLRQYNVYAVPENSAIRLAFLLDGGERTTMGESYYTCSNYEKERYGKREVQVLPTESGIVLFKEDSAWSYIWKEKTDTVGNGAVFEILPRDVEMQTTYQLSMEASYQPDTDNKLEPRKIVKNFDLTVFPKPEAVPSWTKERYVVWNNTPNTVTVETSGGNPDNTVYGWKYEWLQDGNKLENETVKNLTRTFTGTTSISCSVSNTDPDGYTLYMWEDNIEFEVFDYPDVSLSGELISSYQGYERSISLNGTNVKWDGEKSITWEQNENVMSKDKSSFTPTIIRELDPHETDSVNCSVKVYMLPEGMIDSLAYTFNESFNAYFWPEPSVRLYVNTDDINNNGSVDLGDKLDDDVITVRADLSKCMDEDIDGWGYNWYLDDMPRGEHDTLQIHLKNETAKPTQPTYNVHLTASYTLYGETKDYTCSDSLKITCKVHPLFYIDKLKVLYENMPEECVDTIILSGRTYSAMYGGKVVLPYHARWENVSFEKVEIKEANSPDDGYHLLQNTDYYHSLNDTAIIIEPNVFDKGKEYGFRVSVNLIKDSQEECPVSDYSDIPCIQWYEFPEIKILNDEWNEDYRYHVWNNDSIETSVLISSWSTGIWEIQNEWRDTSVISLPHDFSKLDFAKIDGAKLDSTFSVNAICYAPDSNTIWYEKELKRKFAVWKQPDASSVRPKHMFAYNDSITHTSNDTLNVCTKFSKEGEICLSVEPRPEFNTLDWEYRWYRINKDGTDEDEQQDANSADLSYQFAETDSNSIIKYRVFVRARPSTNNGQDTILAQTVELSDTFVTKVWPAQTASIKHDSTYHYYTDGRSGKQYMFIQIPDTVPSLKINTSGGIPEKNWKLEWRDENGQKWKPDVSNEVQKDTLWKKYQSDITVGYDNLNYYKGSVLEYIVKVYPKISVKVYIQEQEEGKYTAFYQTDSIRVIPHNDYAGIGHWNWEFNYYSRTDTSSQPFTVYCDTSKLDNRDDSLVISYTVTCNAYEGEDLRIKDDTGRIAVKIWPLASIKNPHPNDTLSTYTGLALDLEPEWDGPSSSDYWTYTWTSDKADDSGYDESKKNKQIYTYIAKNDPESPVLITYSLTATYKRNGGHERKYEGLKFPIKLYKKPGKPLYDETSIHRVRSGDSTVYKLYADLNSGNPKGWKFVLSKVRNGKEIEVGTFKDTKLLSTGKLSFEEETHTDFKPGYDEYSWTVKCSNINPDNNKSWYDTLITLNKSRVYRVPYAPEKLKQKGDGTSGIYIADGLKLDSRFYNELDEFLSANEYLFEFGADNDIIQQDDTRYCYYRGTGSPWVRSYWIYSDVDGEEDFYCYSDTVGLNSQQLLAPSPASFSFDGSRFVADVAEPVRAMVSIYSSVGNVISAVSYAEDTHFEGVMNVPELSSGIYLLRFEIGEMVEERKILVK